MSLQNVFKSQILKKPIFPRPIQYSASSILENLANQTRQSIKLHRKNYISHQNVACVQRCLLQRLRFFPCYDSKIFECQMNLRCVLCTFFFLFWGDTFNEQNTSCTNFNIIHFFCFPLGAALLSYTCESSDFICLH